MSIQGDESGALSHLVEAATALARLTQNQGAPPASVVPTTTSVGPGSVISDEESNAMSAGSDPQISASAEKLPCSAAKREIFPQRLLSILNDASLSDVITWLPHGRSFVIIRPDVFTEKVLPKYLPPVDARASTKYPSFTRKLNRWGFRQATRGPDTGAFHHPLFRRDQADACLGMVCQRSRERKTVQTKKMNKSLPLKKRVSLQEFAPLTKESLDSMMPTPPASSSFDEPHTVSVDDNRSIASSASPSSHGSNTQAARGPTQVASLRSVICTDPEFVQKALRRRDEEERLKVAKAMLYQSFLGAMNGTK